MKIDIAVFGSQKFLDQLDDLSDNKEVNLIYFPYDHPSGVTESLPKAANCDGWLFAGMMPYEYAKSYRYKVDIPSVKVPINELTFSYSFLHIINNLGIALNDISIDTPDKSILFSVTDEAQMNGKINYAYELTTDSATKYQQIQSLYHYHHSLWKQGGTKLALTCVHTVYDKLQSEGVPSMYVIDPSKNIIDTLDQIISQVQLKQKQGSQMASGMIDISPTNEKFDLKSFIETFSRENNIDIQYKNNEFMLYSTRGTIELITKKFREPLFTNNEITYSVGIGFGNHLQEAIKHANIAFDLSKKSAKAGLSETFIVSDEQKIIGPLEHIKSDMTYETQLKSEDLDVIDISKTAGISVLTVNKLLHFLELRNNQAFTSNDWSVYFNVSKRTGERVIKRLFDSGYLIIAGEEQPHLNGRPRTLYNWNHNF
ncbi:hypothetical protein EV207_1692 [Scopulibacillus darangshiensis]|uniref:Transcriptional regulator n=1 Tax=Scopulibacillus darangshiensis TaxID=442528 RepID=A0A4R2NCD9_9BACL|nr:hypothetical protein [Scopulibacillus darangshiensis]TCP18728.1 hypothetical protein EV207_1692 [Scopulibacillus darangshiensis]